MQKLFFLLFFLAVLHLSAQLSVGLKTVEIEGDKPINGAAIEALSYEILNIENDEKRDSLNKELIDLLRIELNKKEALTYPFSEVESMSILSPADSSFRIFNWNIPYNDGHFAYECAVLKKEKEDHVFYFLEAFEKDSSNPELLTLVDNHWYPALYYDMIAKSTSFGTYYTLLGWEGNNRLSQKKVIDVLWFDGNGNAKLGAPLFSSKGEVLSRRIFEFAAQNTMQLFYNERASRIQFDHLSPPNSTLKGVYEYYGPDMSFDAYYWANNKWNLKEDIDPDDLLPKNKKDFDTRDKILDESPIYEVKP